MSQSLRSQSVSFDQDLLAHPWWVLVKEICDEVPSDVMKNLIFISKQHLGNSFHEIYDTCNGLKFFHVLEEKLGYEKVAKYVENLLSHSNIHDGTGCNRLSVWVEEYRKQLENYHLCCLQNGIPRDVSFVGRCEEVKRILKILRDSDCRGVFIHGSEGMGKTTLAEEVCYNMKAGDERYNVLVLDLRGRKTLNDLLHEFLPQLCVASFETSSAVLKRQVYYAVRENKSLFRRMTVLLWDSVEDILENDQIELMDFLEQLLNTMVTMHADCKARLLLTCRNELPKPLPSLESIGLKPLSHQDSKNLLTRLALPNIGDVLLSSVADYCGGCPLALRIASCSILNITSGNVQQPPEIKDTEFLMNHLLSKIFTSLDQASREMLVKLSIFESSPFDHSAAIKILEAEKDEAKVKEFLQRMTDKHLIEVRDKNSTKCPKYSVRNRSFDMSSRGSLGRSFESTRSLSLALSRSSFDSSVGRSFESTRSLSLAHSRSSFDSSIDSSFDSSIDSSFDSPFDDAADSYGDHEYSFHQYISCFLKKQSETDVFRDCIQDAKVQFLKHFISVLSNCGNTNDASPLECLQLLAKHKIHVKIFFKLLNEEKQSVSEFLSKKTAKSRQQHLSNISCLSGLVFSVDDRRHYFQREAMKSMDKQDVSQYIQWKCEEAEAYLEEGKCDEAKKIIDDVFGNHLHKMRTVINDNPGYKVHVVAWFHYVKARYYLHDSEQKSVNKERYEYALSELQISRHLYKGNFDCYRDWFAKKSAKCMKSFATSHASVLNMMGRVWFVKGDLKQSVEDRKKAFEKAQKYHEKALEILSERKTNRLDVPVYQTNIGACIHKLFLIAEKDKKKELCTEALSWYDKSKKTSVKLHQDFNIGYADTLRNRSDIYRLKSKLDGENKQNCLEEAVTDAAESLKIKEILLTPQDMSLIRSAYDLADVSRLLAIECDNASKLREASENYQKVLQLIQARGFPWIDTKDKLYQRIKAGHRKVLEKLKCPLKMEKARKDYEEIESRWNNISEKNMDLPSNQISKPAFKMNDPMEVQDTSFNSQQRSEFREQMSEVKEENVKLQPSQENEVTYSWQDSKVGLEKEESLTVPESEGYLCDEMKPQQESEVKGEDERPCHSVEMSVEEDQVYRTEVGKRRSLKRQKSVEIENFDSEIKEKIGLGSSGETSSLSSDYGHFRKDSGVDLCSPAEISVQSRLSSRNDSSLESDFTEDESFKTPIENMTVIEENSVSRVDSGVESDAELIQSGSSDGGQLTDMVKRSCLTSLEEEKMFSDN